MKRTLFLATGLILLASTVSILAQGSLTPPGAPAPTMKTLDQVVIIRNTASGNTTNNYDIVAGNKVGTIVLAPDSVAITGDTGGAGVGTTNPWANLTF